MPGPGQPPIAVRQAVERLKLKHQSTGALMRKLASDPSATRRLQDETREFWRALVKSLGMAPGAEDSWARAIASDGGTDLLTILAHVEARGIGGAAEYCWGWLSTAPRAQTGSTDAVQVYARYKELQVAYAAVISAYEKAVDEPPYTKAKGRDLERACERLRRAGGAALASAGNPGEAAQIKSCAAAADSWWSAYRAAVPWHGAPQEGTVQKEIDTLLSEPSMRNAMFLLPPRGWYDLAILRNRAGSLVGRLGGEGGWLKNLVANRWTGDEATKCYDRARLFGLNETMIDPFTNKRSNLPYEDVTKGGGGALRGTSADWALDEADSRVGGLREHHACQFTWTGGFRPGVGTPPLPKFVVDTWRGGEYLLCTLEKWRSKHPD